MSQLIANLHAENPAKRNRAKLLALVPAIEFLDGRTKQCHRDECDIQKIMARFAVTQTFSHLEKNEAMYGDFSDFDFHGQMQKLTRGREIFDELDAEIRREFGQSPAAFFAYVNDPANKDDLLKKLPGLAKPGTQIISVVEPTADEAAVAAASEPASETIETPPA